MRTTLDIDDAVLAAARSLAAAEGLSIGAAVSRLARRGLGLESAPQRVDVSYSPFPVLTGNPDHVVTLELVNEQRDGD
jgi:hypothetical protein